MGQERQLEPQTHKIRKCFHATGCKDALASTHRTTNDKVGFSPKKKEQQDKKDLAIELLRLRPKNHRVKNGSSFIGKQIKPWVLLMTRILQY
jgi:hypothetical protein